MPADADNRAKILVVDDESTHVQYLKLILAKHGYTDVESTTEPRDALSLFHRVAPDLIVLDILMPGIGGMQLLKDFRAAISPDEYLPIVILTADLTREVRREALAIGANDFVLKPYDASEVLSRIDNLLATRFLHRRLSGEKRALLAEVTRSREIEKVLEAERDERRDFYETPQNPHIG